MPPEPGVVFICCARHFLESRDDFKRQRSALQELVEKSSRIFDIYPKYHLISAQFRGLASTVYGSRMAKDEAIIHYQKSTATIPSQAYNMSQLAYFLLTVMSLQASTFNSANNNIIFRDGSPEPSSNSNSNEYDIGLETIGDNWIELERASRVPVLIEERIKEIGYDDGVLTCVD